MRTFVFQISISIIVIHNDSMYVRFGGTANTKTWSKSTQKAMTRQIKGVFNTMTQLNLAAGGQRSNLKLAKHSQNMISYRLFSHLKF